MKKLQHKPFTIMPTGRQVRHEQASSPIRYWYAPLGKGFAVIASDNDKKRPWFKRYEA